MISFLTCKYVAEREGFEPPGRLHDRLLSRQLQSTGLCHRSKPVRRQQVHRPVPVQALSYQVLAPSAARIYSQSYASRGTRLTTNPRELELIWSD